MADSVVIECPVTPERIDQCPATPDLILNVKSPDSSASSDTDCPLNLRTQSSDSPPPNCAICLGRCKNKCFTDSCLHQFCFKCLLEWSKVKAECPLCKQPFKSIIHNVKSIDQFEEYLVGQPQQIQPNIPPVPLPMPALTHFNHHPQPSAHSLTHHIHHRSASAAAAAAAAAAHSLYPHRFDVFLGDYSRFRSELFSTTVQVHPSDNDTLQQLILQRSLLADRLRQQYPDEIIPPGSLGQLWRRYIYDRRLYAMPVVDITGRYRECSARFFRDNPAQMHRLMGWLNRDVVCLLRDSEHHASYVLNVISELLRIFNITSPDFRRRCQHYFRQRTSHFIHEFLNFARSPYDMIGYDREVRYSPYYEEVIIPSSSSSSSLSDSEDAIHMRAMNRGRSRATAEFTIETRSNCSTFILTGTFDGQSATNIASTSRTSGIIELSDGIVQPQMLGQSRIIQIGRNITLSSSSSDECEFVCEQKPPHLRTPELVTLNSASDSDVVFVSERKTKTILPASIIRQMVSSRKRKIPKEVISSLSTGSSSSSSSSGESDKDDEEPESKKERNPDGAASDDSKPSIDGLNKVKDEYNNGASTSSGIQSSEHKLSKSSKANSSNSKKYYARPVRQASSKKLKNSKSIYEESSTENEADSGKSSSSVSFKSEESSDSDSTSIILSKTRMKKRRKRKHERRRTHTESSSCKKKKSKKSTRKKSKRNKTVVPSSSSTSKLRNKKCKSCVSSSPSCSSLEESEAYKANGWSSSSSSD